ncbi:aldose epimerase family protein [Sphingomonas qomolangmaensis]|uniref:Aldose 1-epimerase n=1 Tax=Sphingomonas qomolangmaensis TaxID=2918765 RepID=A0ABY5L8R3_9SPHN|nr:aldose epimerase family protein [Sphingomonas qomolangmaensis]UUL82346.1 galactose mutarotase [Sphingomonas qomolangmaensis]
MSALRAMPLVAVALMVAPGAQAQVAGGIVDDDPAIREYVLQNANGTRVRFLNYGATVTGVEVADRAGRRTNVVLSYPRESDYRRGSEGNWFGSMIGRYAGRIADARFPLDGRVVQLKPNSGPNALHGGGGQGPDRAIWRVREFSDRQGVGAVLRHVSPAGTQGYPGTMTITVVYRLSDDDALTTEISATTDAPTVVNLTNHAYFNLRGAGSGTVEDHLLSIAADEMVVTREGGIPTGALARVAGTPLDFRDPHAIGARIDATDRAIKPRPGYDHGFVLRGGVTDEPRSVAVLTDPASGRTLTIETTEPSVQFYTAEHMDGSEAGSAGPLTKRAGAALETQHFPDSPNQPSFPSTELRPGQSFESVTVWRFGVVAK